VEGRGLDATDRYGAEPVILINQAAALRYWPGEEVVGKSIRVFIGVGYPEEEPRRIVGVVRDFRDEVTGTVGAEMYVPYAQVGAGFPHVVLALDGVTAATALDAARRELAALDPELPLIRPGTLEGLVAEEMAASRFTLLLLGLFAVMAVSLAAVGIYGVVAYTVVQRTREIGMRMALGARVRQVVGLVVWQGVAPALGGLLLGVAGALLFGRVMEGILFQVEPTDPITFLAAAAAIVLVVLGATAVPARRATRIPPAEALRME
jgi:putative ABC transport system permease protein